MTGVTVDSNIWVSAFHFGGIPRQLIEMGDGGLIRIDVSDEIVEEVLRVLRLKFEWPEEPLQEAKSQMEAISHKVKPEVTLDVVKDDTSDNRILECADAGNSDFIVTGDKHLLRLGRFEDIPIIRAAAFLQGNAG